MNLFKKFALLPILLAITFPIFAQNPTVFAGIANAYDFAYGVNSQVAPLRVDIGNTATGAGTVTLAYGFVALSDGRKFSPITITTPIQIGIGANIETVTPSAVSCSTPAAYDTCSVTATFANLHGTGDLIATGTFGLAEAVNYTHTLGGLVAFDGRWASAGGLVSQFASKTYGWINVTLLDWRGTSNSTTRAFSYYSGSATAPTNGGAYIVSTAALY